MARVSREQSEHHRQEIMEVAARLFRERGLNGVGVAELMAAAGLTHGGFYGHFASKDALAAAACSRAFDQAASRWDRAIASHPDKRSALAAIVSGYLQASNRDAPGPRCPIAALAGDVVREPPDKPVRAAFAAGLEELVSKLALLNASEDGPDRRQAITQFATLVGALTLARATRGDPLSDEILEAVRRSLGVASEPPG